MTRPNSSTWTPCSPRTTAATAAFPPSPTGCSRASHPRNEAMAVNLDELKALSEAPGVATACGPVSTCLRALLPDHVFEEVTDGGLVALPRGTDAAAVRLLFVTHVDEVGGFVTFPEEGGYGARLIGNRAGAFAETPLQAFRYDA